jgi:creatinine amidohydrolase
MQWEHLTSDEFHLAVRATGVCIIAMGVVERHSTHLPLGTDYLSGHAIACLAAEKEKAVVFPPFYFGQIYEARCFPGTITIKPTLLMELVQGVLDEIGRNGFKKIILLNAHGGNEHFLPFLAQCSLWEKKSYSIYLYTRELSPEREQEWQSLLETPEHGHACECESSVLMASYPELVDMSNVSPHPGTALHRLSHLPANYSAIWWYADYPEHYAGDARSRWTPWRNISKQSRQTRWYLHWRRSFLSGRVSYVSLKQVGYGSLRPDHSVALDHAPARSQLLVSSGAG